MITIDQESIFLFVLSFALVVFIPLSPKSQQQSYIPKDGEVIRLKESTEIYIVQQGGSVLSTPGTYQSHWRMRNERNEFFGTPIWVKIVMRSLGIQLPDIIKK
jgi:hypothetical protein